MRKTTITCDKCGKEIKHSGEYYSPPEYVSVVVTTHSNGAVPAVLGWSNEDYYEFCFNCHGRDTIKGLLLDLVKVKTKINWTKWVKREDLPCPPESAVRETMSDEL